MTSILLAIAAKGTVVALVFILVGRHLRKASAATRNLVLGGGLVVLAALPLLELAVPWHIEMPTATLRGVESGMTARSPGEVHPEIASRSPGSAEASRRVGGGTVALSPALVLLWGAGALLFLGRLGRGWVESRRLARTAWTPTGDRWSAAVSAAAAEVGPGRPVRVLLSPDVVLPLTMGVRRPVVVLPAAARDWDEERVRAVLAHELAHVRRGDLVLHWLGGVTCSLHWFNPLVWLLARRTRAESEKACDDQVLATGVLPSSYASHLLDIVRSAGVARPPATTLPLAHESEFEGRLLAILEAGSDRRPPPVTTVAGVIVGMAALAVPLAALGGPGSEASPSPNRQVSSDSLSSSTEMPPAVAALIDLMASDTNPEIRAAAAASLGRYGDPRALEALASAAADTAAEVRPSATWSLQELDDERALTVFIRALEDADPRVRAIAVRGIGDLDLDEAPPPLLQALSDPDPRVREMAALAVGEVGR